MGVPPGVRARPSEAGFAHDRGYARAPERAKFRGSARHRVAHLADMLARRRSRLGRGRWIVLPIAAPAVFALAACTFGGALGACANDDATAGSDGGGAEAASEAAVRPGDDASMNGEDAPAPREDSGDAGVVVVNGPGEAGAPCSFNRECNAALRCECNETTGCECKPGTRGTGKNGVDPCIDGNACASSLCVEGPPDAGSFCSDECDASAGCTGKLPVCSNIAFVGQICIRQPPM
jgi:hypothetical protein